MKGIILAGGTGSRLFPATIAFTKQLLPIYDKPMIYYPLSVLMLAGIRDILVITTREDLSMFKKLLGKGNQWGIRLAYAVQEKPEGIAQAFLIGKEFIGNESVALILGDNIFYGQSFTHTLREAVARVESTQKALIFSYYVKDPEAYGVVEFDAKGNALSIEEKPAMPRSHYAVVGLYFYPPDVVSVAEQIAPSDRGELEITTVNQEFLSQKRLSVQSLGRGFAWLDTGTHQSLYEAGDFVRVIEQRQGLKIACLEEIAWNSQWIGVEEIQKSIQRMGKSSYGGYLNNLLLSSKP